MSGETPDTTLNCATYQNISSITSKLNSYIRDISGYIGQSGTWAGAQVPLGSVTSRTLELGIPPGATPAQMQAIQNAVNSAQQQGVNFIVKVIQ